MADKSFYEAFKSNMDAIGLPCPESIYGTVTTATANIAVMAAAIKTLGAGATMSELFLTIPVAGGSAALATAVGEICLVVGAVAAAFYVGACIGSLINALLDTYGIPALVELMGWARQIADDVGMTLDQLLAKTIQEYPQTSSMRPTINVARHFYA